MSNFIYQNYITSMAKGTKTFRLGFFGGAQSVTGANFLLEGPLKAEKQYRFLVDCGIEQGVRYCEECNLDTFIYDPSSIDVLFITHAHLDHIGRIPKLIREGFGGTIYSTPATKEISTVMFEDSISIISREAKAFGKEPLYSEKDVERAIQLWKTIPYYTKTTIPGEFSFCFRDAGHILGSAMVEIVYNGSKVVFTGDIGNSPAPLLRDTDIVTDADYMVMESVYGDRNHEPREERTQRLRKIIHDTISRGGVLMIPAFSIERTQVLLYEINNLVEDGKIPPVPVYLDSPLAIKVTDIYRNRIQNFNGAVQEEIKGGDDIFRFPNLHFTFTRDESRKINSSKSPKIIIAGSGMSHGGRIVHHEKQYLSDSKNTILFVGYQAAGSLGRKIQEGNKKVKIFDDEITVRAQIENISGYSAHKDSEGLIEFVGHTAEQVSRVFVAMGEPKSALFLVQRLHDYLGVNAVAPKKGEQFEIKL